MRPSSNRERTFAQRIMRSWRSTKQTALSATHATPRVRCEAALLVLLFAGCYGDFGRPRQTVFTPDRTLVIEDQAAAALGQPASKFQLTDEEKVLRERAYVLIRPPYSREQWYFLMGEFTRTGRLTYVTEVRSYGVYAGEMLATPTRSASARYSQLIDDLRSDLGRIDPFVAAAGRVADFDRKRQESLAYVSDLTLAESANAAARIAENAMILEWVQHCLGERTATYRYILERLIIASPETQAVVAERLLIELERRVPQMYAGIAIAPPARPAVLITK